MMDVPTRRGIIHKLLLENAVRERIATVHRMSDVLDRGRCPRYYKLSSIANGRGYAIKLTPRVKTSCLVYNFLCIKCFLEHITSDLKNNSCDNIGTGSLRQNKFQNFMCGKKCCRVKEIDFCWQVLPVITWVQSISAFSKHLLFFIYNVHT